MNWVVLAELPSMPYNAAKITVRVCNSKYELYVFTQTPQNDGKYEQQLFGVVQVLYTLDLRIKITSHSSVSIWKNVC